jgi:hypothetical protein
VGKGVHNAGIYGKKWIELVCNMNPFCLRSEKKKFRVSLKGVFLSSDNDKARKLFVSERAFDHTAGLDSDALNKIFTAKWNDTLDLYQLGWFQAGYHVPWAYIL